jgi:serine/threonine protein kinase
MSAKTVTPSTDRSAELALLVEKLSARLEAGEPVDVEQIARDYPEHAAELRDLLPAVALMVNLSRSGERRGVSPTCDDDGPLGELGDFRLIREVGRGGMGIVYEAEQISLNRRVALKVLPYAATMDPKQLQRFKNESRAAASLRHEHIVHVYGVGCERGVHYYAMEFIDGLTLAQIIAAMHPEDEASREPRRPEEGTAEYVATSSVAGLCEAGPRVPSGHAKPGSQTPATAEIAALSTQFSGPKTRDFYRIAARLIADAADALEHAHSLGIVHRDVKPGNLMVDSAGKVYVADFGLARFGPDAGLTMSGDLLGTLRYMAPEQALARHGLADHRMDVYGLGATLYELLTGQPAVRGTAKADIVSRIAFEDPVPPRKLEKAVPPELETVALKCLAKNPNERYATAGELADDLRRWLAHQPIRAKSPSLRQRLDKWVRRHAGVVAAAAAGLLLVAVATAAGAVLVYGEKRRTQAAYEQARRALDDMSLQVIDDWLSQQPVLKTEHREFLERALTYYTEFAAEAGRDVATRMAVADAYKRVGVIRRTLGQTAEADQSLRRAVALQEELVAAEPGVSRHRAELANKISYWIPTLWAAGRWAEAERACRRSIELQETLLPDHPNPKGGMLNLAIYYSHLASTLARQGKLAEAEPVMRRALALREELGDPFWLAGSYSNLGNVLSGMGRKPEAEQYYRRSVELREKLHAERPTDRLHRFELAGAYLNLGGMLSNMDQSVDAEQFMNRAVAMLKELVDEFPAVSDYQGALSDGLTNLGTFLTRAGRLPEAEQAYRRKAEVLEKLVAAETGNARYKVVLASVHRTLCKDVLPKMGRWAEAKQSYHRALTLMEELVEKDAQNPNYTDMLAGLQNGSAWCLATCPDLAAGDAPERSSSRRKRLPATRATEPPGIPWGSLSTALGIGTRPSRRWRGRWSCAKGATPSTGSSWRWPTGKWAIASKPTRTTPGRWSGRRSTSPGMTNSIASARRRPNCSTGWRRPRTTGPHRPRTQTAFLSATPLT